MGMGMSDKQFNAYVRKIKKLVDQTIEAKNPEEKDDFLKDLSRELQQDLED